MFSIELCSKQNDSSEDRIRDKSPNNLATRSFQHDSDNGNRYEKPVSQRRPRKTEQFEFECCLQDDMIYMAFVRAF